MQRYIIYWFLQNEDLKNKKSLRIAPQGLGLSQVKERLETAFEEFA